jgi:hypothetical protein
MKQLQFESAREAEQHLTDTGGKRVQWFCTSKRSWSTYKHVFVTKRKWFGRFSTILVR